MKTAKFEKIENSFKGLGTEIGVQLVVDIDGTKREVVAELLEVIKGKYAFYEKMLSRFDPESELSRLNAESGTWQIASPQLRELAMRAVAYCEQTGGIFDPRIIGALEDAGYKEDFKKGNFISREKNEAGTFGHIRDEVRIQGDKLFLARRIDLSGIAKGYITDKVMELIKQAGFENFLLDSGGDIYASGHAENEGGWLVGLEGFAECAIMLNLSNSAVATSGISRRKWEVEGRRFHHLIDPRSPGKFEFELKSVTVIADTTEVADVWAKTLFLMGKKKGMVYAKEKELNAIFLDARGNAWVSPEAKKLLS